MEDGYWKNGELAFKSPCISSSNPPRATTFEMQYFFYLARCRDGSLYSGYTRNLFEREKSHNSGKGAKYTAGRRPVEIIYSENFTTKSDALRREAAVKKLSRVEKLKLIRGS